MISEIAIMLATGIAEFFIAYFPADWTLPPEVVNLDATVNDFLVNFEGMGVWAPWALMVTFIGISIAVWGITSLIKAARWLLGLVPTMGGGT